MGKRLQYKVYTDENEYIKAFETFWYNETKRITDESRQKRKGRKPKGFHSLKVEHKTIILTFD